MGTRPTLPALMLVSDVAILLGAGLLAGAWGGLRPAAFIVALTVLVTLLRYRYRWRFTLSALDDLPAIVGAVGVATLVAGAGFGFLTTNGFPEWRVVGTLQAGLVIVIVCVLGRALTLASGRALRRRGIGVARAVILGKGEAAQRLGAALAADADLGVHLVGLLADTGSTEKGGQPVIGTLEALPTVVRDHQVDLVLVACGTGSGHRVVDSVRATETKRCEVFVVPHLHELHDGAAASDIVAGIPLVQLRRLAFRSPTWKFKRLIDIVLAVLALVITAPVFLAVAVAVRIETGPGVIYRQQRVGRDNRPFTLYKFRSLKPSDGEDTTRWSIDGDPRLGKVGVLIRYTSLDELPQLINILRGHMSLVGPRPERPHFVEEFSATVPGYRYRHRMPVGLTGLAVVYGYRGDTGIPARAGFDNLYAEYWSLWLDVKIILRTASQLVPRFRIWRVRMPEPVEQRAPVEVPPARQCPSSPRRDGSDQSAAN